MNILVTGGTGFLGREIIDHLSKRHRIYAIYRYDKGITRKDVHWIKLDLVHEQDFEAAKELLKKEKIDMIIHAGGSTPNRAYIDGSFDATSGRTSICTALTDATNQR